VFTSTGVEKKIEFIEMPEELKGKYQYFTKADPTKLRAAGYRGAFTSLEDGVREYVEFLESRK
jgi:ADP-L-glycero-D-manno-heptose 6-epimerase